MSYFKVLIVDDEYLVRELLKRSINWGDHGLEVVSEATCGMEALEEVEKIQPDILITDICMPIMDGIELSRLVLEKYPQIKVVVLSGHDDFNYARDSVSIGIKEYLLKPIDPVSVSNTLVKLVSEIQKEKEMDLGIKEVFPLLQEKVLSDLLSVRGLRSDIYESLNRYNIEFKSNRFQVGLVEVKSCKENLSLKIEKVFSTIKEYFISQEDYYCFMGSRGVIVILSHGDGRLDSLCELILNNLIQRLGHSIVVGIGREVIGIESIATSYEEAFKALEYQVVEGVDSIIHFSDMGLTLGYDSNLSNKLIKDYAFSVQAGLKEKSANLIDELFKLQIISLGGNINSIRVMASNILSVILSVIMKNEQDSTKIFGDGNQPYNRIFSLNTLEEIVTYLKEISNLVICNINNKNSQITSKLVTEVKSYIVPNLKNIELNLAYVASKFNVNSSYLSRKFKQETGETFMEFLSSQRTMKAIELLKTTDLRSYEIADEIGIGDPHYFSIFFKKKTGLSISEYKKQVFVKK